jgi:putative transposase
VLVSFVYLVACRLFALVLLLARGDRSKELELLVLRHELSILRRNVLARGGIPPAPERCASSWRSFLRQQGNTIPMRCPVEVAQRRRDLGLRSCPPPGGFWPGRMATGRRALTRVGTPNLVLSARDGDRPATDQLVEVGHSETAVVREVRDVEAQPPHPRPQHLLVVAVGGLVRPTNLFGVLRGRAAGGEGSGSASRERVASADG